jgi:hypothetical protein
MIMFAILIPLSIFVDDLFTPQWAVGTDELFAERDDPVVQRTA